MRGGAKYLLRGIVTHALFNLLDLARDTGVEVFFEEVIDPRIERIKPFRRRARVKRIVKAIRYMYVTIVLIQFYDLLWSELI